MEKKAIYKAIEDGTARELTLAIAKELIGKRIETLYHGYAGQDGTDNFIVTEILSMYDIALREPIEGYTSRAAYWDSSMSPERLREVKETLEILGADDYRTCIRCHVNSSFFDEPTFTCSDADRRVFFTEL